MLTERSRPPTIRTSPTPVERSSCGRTILSAISVNSRSDRSLDSAIVTTGRRLGEDVEIVDGLKRGDPVVTVPGNLVGGQPVTVVP